ncbi:MAG: TetR/AcrR family transcriptional regulator [Thermoleophilaceae bacterium]
MAVNSAPTANDETRRDRPDQLLEAACRVITRGGTRRLSLQEVADEAGVSKTLIHYYFSNRDDLLAKAYEFGDERGRERVRQRLPEQGSAVERLARLLTLYLGDEPEISEDWLLWTELSSAAVFEPELRPVMQRSFARWRSWIESLVRDAILEGVTTPDTEPGALSLRLIALVDGLGSLLVRKLIDHQQASAALNAILEQELGFTPAESKSPAGGRVALSSTYLRLLAALAREAVTGLDTVAETPDDRAALGVVEQLINRAAGGQPLVEATAGKRDAGQR